MSEPLFAQGARAYVWCIDTSEVSWLIEPPAAIETVASVQQFLGWTAVAILATGPWSSLPLLILAACTGGLCITMNAISESRRLLRQKQSKIVQDEKSVTIHRVSIVNTLTGWNFYGLARIVVILFNAIVASIWVFGALVRPELDKAWGCYSAELSIDYLTAGPCTINAVPDRCWDVYPFHGTEKPCWGHREAGGAWTQHVPPIILVIEWVLVAGYVFRNSSYEQLAKKQM